MKNYLLIASCLFINFLTACQTGVNKQPRQSTNAELQTASPTPYRLALRKGQEVQLQRGINKEIVDQLKSGNPAYLVMAFETPNDQPVQSIFKTMRESEITFVSFNPGDFTSFLTVVHPENLSTLEDMARNGLLLAAAQLPPASKIDPKLSEELEANPQGTVRVDVELFIFPEAEQKKELSRLLRNVYFPSIQGGRTINGEIRKKNIPRLTEVPYVIWVNQSFGGQIIPPP